jgi:KaiC/GvpD/RAD55 family RecA-like ATPase
MPIHDAIATRERPKCTTTKFTTSLWRVLGVPTIPLIQDLTSGSIPPGSNLLVEFDPPSQWYNASLTIAAGWLKSGGRAWYFANVQPPDNIRIRLRSLGVPVDESEAEHRLRIHDVFTATLGQKSKEKYAGESLKVQDLSIQFSREDMRAPREADLLRIADNASTIARFNDEKAWVEFLLTRGLPAVGMQKLIGIRGIANGVHSDWAYKQLETAADGIIDFKLDEKVDPPQNVIRLRSMRNVGFDGRWHKLKIRDNFEVILEK